MIWRFLTCLLCSFRDRDDRSGEKGKPWVLFNYFWLKHVVPSQGINFAMSPVSSVAATAHVSLISEAKYQQQQDQQCLYHRLIKFCVVNYIMLNDPMKLSDTEAGTRHLCLTTTLCFWLRWGCRYRRYLMTWGGYFGESPECFVRGNV